MKRIAIIFALALTGCYRMTVKSGAVVLEDDRATGELPGTLVRGPQQA